MVDLTLVDDSDLEPETTPMQPLPLAGVARQEIKNALKAAAGNVAQAADRLGVHRSTLYRHLRRQDR